MTEQKQTSIEEMVLRIQQVRVQAHYLALANPIGFLVLMGCSFAEYDRKLAELEASLSKLRDRVEA